MDLGKDHRLVRWDCRFGIVHIDRIVHLLQHILIGLEAYNPLSLGPLQSVASALHYDGFAFHRRIVELVQAPYAKEWHFRFGCSGKLTAHHIFIPHRYHFRQRWTHHHKGRTLSDDHFEMKVVLGRWPLPHGEDIHPYTTGQVRSSIAQSSNESAEGSLVAVADEGLRLAHHARLLHRFELHEATSCSARERDHDVSQHFTRGDFIEVECATERDQKGNRQTPIDSLLWLGGILGSQPIHYFIFTVDSIRIRHFLVASRAHKLPLPALSMHMTTMLSSVGFSLMLCRFMKIGQLFH